MIKFLARVRTVEPRQGTGYPHTVGEAHSAAMDAWRAAVTKERNRAVAAKQAPAQIPQPPAPPDLDAPDLTRPESVATYVVTLDPVDHSEPGHRESWRMVPAGVLQLEIAGAAELLSGQVVTVTIK